MTTTSETKKKVIEVVDRKTQEVVKSIDVTGKSERSIERTEDGININLNHTDYFTQVKEI